MAANQNGILSWIQYVYACPVLSTVLSTAVPHGRAVSLCRLCGATVSQLLLFAAFGEESRCSRRLSITTIASSTVAAGQSLSVRTILYRPSQAYNHHDAFVIANRPSAAAQNGTCIYQFSLDRWRFVVTIDDWRENNPSFHFSVRAIT